MPMENRNGVMIHDSVPYQYIRVFAQIEDGKPLTFIFEGTDDDPENESVPAKWHHIETRRVCDDEEKACSTNT